MSQLAIHNSIESQVFAAVSRLTGHQLNALSPSMTIEEEVGLDSINIVILMSELVEIIPENKRNQFIEQYPPDGIAQLQNLGELIAILENFGAAEAVEKDEANGAEKQAAATSLGEVAETVPFFHEMQLTGSQLILFLSYWHLSTLTVANRITIIGRLDEDLLQRAWGQVVARHPSLQACFTIPDGTAGIDKIRFVIEESSTNYDIDLQDYSSFPVELVEYSAKDKAEEIINTRIPLESRPLHRLFVSKLPGDRIDILFATSHLVSDGLGNQQILRELLEEYQNIEEGKEADVSKSTTVDHYNFQVNEINSWFSAEESAQYDRYEQSLSKNEKRYFWNPARKNISDSEPSNEHICTLHNRLPKKETLQLSRVAGQWGISLFALLTGAYLSALKSFDRETERITLNLPTSGKVYPQTDASDLVGCFAQNIVLSFDVRDLHRTSPATFLKKVDAVIKHAVINGYDRVQVHRNVRDLKEKMFLRDGALPESMASFIRAVVRSNLYLSYMGDTRINRQYNGLEVRDYASYSTTFSGAVDNLVEIFGDELQISTNYDATFFEEGLVVSLMDKFVDNLTRYVATKPLGRANDAIMDSPPSLEQQPTDHALNEIVGQVCRRRVGPEDYQKDLQAELRIDSLEKIRIITMIGKQYHHVSRESLFDCRTLKQMSEVIHSQGPPLDSAHVTDGLPYWSIIRQCRKTPGKVAVRYAEKEMTYGKLHALSNQLAHFLRRLGISNNTPILLMTGPGPDMLVSMLAILKAGGAYVPIDPDFPEKRIQYIIRNSGARTILTESIHGDQGYGSLLANDLLENIIYLGGAPNSRSGTPAVIGTDRWRSFPESMPENISRPDDLMNILYTSGSTGAPKGIMSSHAGYMNQLGWHQKTFPLVPGDRVAQKTTFGFDISIWELIWPLMHGATVCPVHKEVVKNPWRMKQWLQDEKINLLLFVPSEFGEFIHALEDEPLRFPHLRWIQFIGEALPCFFVRKWLNLAGSSTNLVNLYGPTEASIAATYHMISKRPGNDQQGIVSIGKPMDNVYVRILDESMKPVPVGEVGELWLGGVQLAKGVYNDPQKTAEAFRPNPFADIPGDFIYQTGDLARELPDGSFEYHGRVDNQIKIRGFRVELGEIEAVLAQHPGIREVAVIPVSGTGRSKRLVACLAGERVSSESLKQHLGARVAAYMIPHEFKWLTRIPKNTNGKLDRKNLEQMLQGGANERDTHLQLQDSPATCAPKVGPTRARSDNCSAMFDLGPAQQWLIHYFSFPHRWTGYTRFVLHKEVQPKFLQRAIVAAVQRHDGLCVRFVLQDEQWRQQALPPESVTAEELIDYYDGSHLSESLREPLIRELLNSAVQNFDISHFPLIKFILIRTSTTEHDISVVGHHIVADLLTSEVILNDILTAYRQLVAGTPTPDFRPVPSFRQYVESIRNRLDAQSIQHMRRYWTDCFPSPDCAMPLTNDAGNGPNSEQSAKRLTFSAGRSGSRAILGKGKQLFSATAYSLILAPLYKLLAELTGRSHIIISHRGHGRDPEVGISFFATAGNFAVHYPVGIQVAPEDDWGRIVRRIKHALDAVPMKGVSYDCLAEHLPEYLYPDDKLTSIRANYHGNRSQPPGDEIEFLQGQRDIRYSEPGQQRMSNIEFFFYHDQGELYLEIDFSTNMHTEQRIREMGERYVLLLQDLAAGILSAGNREGLRRCAADLPYPRERTAAAPG